MIQIAHNKPTLGRREKAAASRVITSGWVAQGSEVAAFEEEICRFFDLPSGHAIVVSSGSAALFLALWVLNGKETRVGLPAYSCAALRNAVALISAQAVYLDSAPNSPNMDLTAPDAADIDILIAPSMFGIPLALPETRHYRVIEDLAQSLGAKVDGKLIGLRGDVGVCSFYATKIMTSGGQGGAVVSRDKALIDKLRDYREFDARTDNKSRFNFQMTDMQAAIGRVQLEALPDFIKKRAELFAIYEAAGLDLVRGCNVNENATVHYRAVMQHPQPVTVISKLASVGVRAIVPITEQEMLDSPQHYPAAHQFSKSTVSLPIYPLLPLKQARRIANVVSSIR